MNISNSIPCSDWAQKLSAGHLDELTPSEHIALKEHLAMCRACNEAHMAYQTIKANFRSLLVNETKHQMSLHSHQKAKSSVSNLEFILPDVLTFFSTMFATIFFSFYLSNLYLKFHYWLLLIPSIFSRKIAYATTSGDYLYAIRSESGFMVWRQKGYQKHNILYTVPVRMIGIHYFSGGIALLSAFDFCKYTARA